jgi:retron-type reverse transcriptase
MKTNWRPLSYFIPFDVVKAFDRVNHAILRKALKNQIGDQRVINEIQKMLNAKVVHFEDREQTGERPTLGTPQGSVLSPFLFNVYMHSLDQWMEKLMQDHNIRPV